MSDVDNTENKKGINFTLYRKTPRWVRFIQAQDADKITNTMKALVYLNQEPVALVADDPEISNVVHVRFLHPVLVENVA